MAQKPWRAAQSMSEAFTHDAEGDEAEDQKSTLKGPKDCIRLMIFRFLQNQTTAGTSANGIQKPDNSGTSSIPDSRPNGRPSRKETPCSKSSTAKKKTTTEYYKTRQGCPYKRAALYFSKTAYNPAGSAYRVPALSSQ